MHTLLCGVTESGKTTAGKALAQYHRAMGYKILVLTAVWENWPADFITLNKKDFLTTFWESKGCAAFIDEAAATVGRYSDVMNEVATKGRHYGHTCYFLVQDPTGLAPEVRRQCSQLFCFAIDPTNAETLSREFLQPEVLKAPTLKQGEYIRCLRFGPDGRPSFTRGKVF